MTPQSVHNHLRAILRTNDIVQARVHAAYAISELTGGNAFALLSESAHERSEDAAALALDHAAQESATRASYGRLEDHNAHVDYFKRAVAGEQVEAVVSPAEADGYHCGRVFRHLRNGGDLACDSLMVATMSPDSSEMPAEAMSRSAAVAS